MKRRLYRQDGIIMMGWLCVMLLTVEAMAQSYRHDSEGRLVETRYDATHHIVYGYDTVGNLTNLSVTGTQAETDTDGDGMPDAWEWVYFNNLTNAADGDPNLNGKNNLWEYQNGYDPMDPDSDGDGAPNTDETAAGTDPLNPESVFEVSVCGVRVSGNVVQWYSVTNKYYRIERSTNLPAFSQLRTNILATPPLNSHTDTTASGSGPWLYRIHQE